ncbi:hypothetical protein DFJ74DRAFT_600747 [Hyaloraphidium curvatum]|nr:hypothetical protein DFJ74DRAFT_600747 [Hyaloraphidium curvatum]
MLENLLASVLNRTVGQYVQNLEQSQLNVAVWKGDVVLRNLRLKREALDKFNLPIDVVEGYLGELKLVIPWSDLSGSSVRVQVKDLYVLAGPKAESEARYDPVLEEERLQKAKMDKLATFDELLISTVTGDKQDQASQVQQESFVSSLVRKIVNNLEVTIENIHIRYEDKTSNASHPFAVGFTLSTLSAHTTTKDWKPAFASTDDVTYKLLELRSLAAYFNTDTEMWAGSFASLDEFLAAFKRNIATASNMPSHQYVLRPVSGTGKASRDGAVVRGNPNVGDFEFNEFALVLDNNQYSSVMLLLGGFTAFTIAQRYRALHPPRGVTPKMDPGAWIRFAGKAVLFDIHERNRKWTWDFIRERRDDRVAYLRLWRKVKTGAVLSIDESMGLEALERKLSFDDLRRYRVMVAIDLKKEGPAPKASPQQPPNPPTASKSTFGWISSWWSGASAEPDKAAVEQPEPALTEEDIQRIYKMIEYNPDEPQRDMVFPPDHVLFQVAFALTSGSINLKTRSDAGTTTDLVSIVFEGLRGSYFQRPTSFKSDAKIGNITLQDNSTPGTLYPVLMSAKQSKDLKTLERDSKPFFFLSYEQNPPGNDSVDHDVKLEMLPVEYVHNPLAITAVTKFFSRPESESDTVEMIKYAAEDTIKGLTWQTRAGFEFILLQKKTTVLHIDAEAPVIVVPESVTDPSSPLVVLDMGRLIVESKPVDPELKRDIRNRQGKALDDRDYERLKASMYDRYSCELRNVQLVMGRDFKTCIEQLVAPVADPAYHVFERIDLELVIEACLLPNEAELPRLRLALSVDRLHLNFSDHKYRGVMNAVQILIGSNSAHGGPPPALDASAKKRTQRTITGLGFSTPALFPTGDPEIVAGDSFFDAPEAPLVAKDAAAVPPPSKDDYTHVSVLFKLKVNTMSASVRRSIGPDVADTVPDEKPLADLRVTNFGVDVTVRPLDLEVGVFVGKVAIVDRMQTYGPEFDMLLESTTDEQELKEGGSQWFIEVAYRGLQRSHPDFAGLDHTVVVSFASVTLMLTADSLLQIQDFVMVTFASPPAEKGGPSNTLEVLKETDSIPVPAGDPASRTDGATATRANVTAGGEQTAVATAMTIDLSMTQIALIVNRRGSRIASGTLGQGALSIHLKETITVSGRLGSLTIEDDMRRRPGFSEFVRFNGDQVAEFKFQTYDMRHPDFPGYDSSVELSTESVRIVYLDYLLFAVLEWLNDLSSARAAMEAARRCATGRFHFKVFIKTPIVVLPRPLENSRDMLEAYLGEISCSNRFLGPTGAPLDGSVAPSNVINEILLDVRSMKLMSSIYLDASNSFEQRLAIIRDVNWKVDADISEAAVRLHEKQYAIVLEMVDHLMQPKPAESGTAERQAHSAAPSPPPEGDLVTSHAEGTGGSGGSSVVHPPALPGEASWVSMDLTVSIASLALEIFTADSMDVGESALASTGLGQFAINGITVKTAMSNLGAIDAEVVVNSFAASDARPKSISVFKEVVPSNRYGKNQLMVRYSRDRKNATEVTVSLESLKIILSLDYIFDIWEWFMHPKYYKQLPTEEGGGDAVVLSRVSAPAASPSPAATGPLSYKIVVVDAEIAVLGDPKVKETEAVSLCVDQIVVYQDSATRVQLRQAGGFEARRTGFRLVTGFDLNAHYETSPTAVKIMVDVSPERPLDIRFSYRDFALFSKLASIASQFSSAQQGDASNGTPGHPPKDASAAPEPENSLGVEGTTAVTESGTRKSELVRHPLDLRVGGLEIVLIDDVTDPMIQMINIRIMPLTLRATEWSGALSLELPIGIAVNYFNVKNSHWEPLVEPWKCSVQMSRADPSGAMEFSFTSSSKLDINFSQIFLETLSLTLRSIGNMTERNLTRGRSVHAPFVIRNRTGYDLVFWSETVSESNDGTATVLKDLPNNTDHKFKFVDSRRMREIQASSANLLCVQITTPLAQWETLKSLSVNSEGTTSYLLRPKIKNVAYRMAVDVQLKENIKYVTLRSTFVIKNDCFVGIEVALFSSATREPRGTYRIAPGTEFAVPILVAYDSSFQVRPDEVFGYNFSNEIVNWSSLKRAGPSPRLTCKPMDRRAPMFRFSIFSKFFTDPKDTYPEVRINIAPPMELENLLPYDIRYTLYVRTTSQEFHETLRRGKISPIHTVEPTDALALKFEIPDTGHTIADVAILSNTEINFRDDKIRMKDTQGRQLLLRLKYIESRGKGTKVVLYSPYVMINYTGLGIQVKSKGGMRDYTAGSDKPEQGSAPFMFSFPEFEEPSSRAVIKIGDSDWSYPVGFDPVGSSYAVDISNSAKGVEAHVGVSVKEGEGKYYLTRVVTFSPRFVVKNNLEMDLQCRQHGTVDAVLVRSRERTPIINLYRKDEKERLLFCVRLAGTMYQWSQPVRVEDIGTTYIKTGRMGSEAEDLIRMEASLVDATIYITREEGRWPFQIQNSSSVDVKIYQYVSDRTKAKLVGAYSVNNAYQIPKGASLPYAWDSPSVEQKVLMIEIGTTKREMNVTEIGPQKPFGYTLRNGRTGSMSVEVRAAGPTTLVKLSDWSPEGSIYQIARTRPGDAVAGAKSPAAVEAGDGRFIVDLSFIGFSIINSDMQEILYTSFQLTRLVYMDRQIDASYDLSIGWWQIDNDLPDSVESIVLYPTQISKEIDDTQPPLLKMLLVHLKDTSYGVDYYKVLKVALQEVSLELDEDLLRMLLLFSKFATVPGSGDGKLSVILRSGPRTSLTLHSFFESFHLGPVKVNLSFTRTERADTEERRSRSMVALMLDVLTHTVGNVHVSHRVRRSCGVLLQNARETYGQLLELLKQRYYQEVMGQIHRIIGSADFLGNPVGLFNTVSSGVVDMFYEPLQGFSFDRPEDFGTGFVKGAKSFARKTVYGFSDTFSKVTGSFGKGECAQAVVKVPKPTLIRHSRRNRPKNTLSGVGSGLKYLGGSVASGVAGVFTKPIEGAQQDSAIGFVSGVGKGVLGLFAKPLVGVFDVSNQLFEGIKSTTTDAAEIDRIRLPRFIGKDKILRVGTTSPSTQFIL